MLGDLDANIEQLRAQLRQVRFPVHRLDAGGLARGRPEASLPILHYALVDLSAPLSRLISEKGYELRSKSDLRFVEGAFRVLREHLNYSPVLTTSQFLAEGFAERKVLLCQDVVALAKRAHGELSGHPMLPARQPRRRASVGGPQAPPTPFPSEPHCAAAAPAAAPDCAAAPEARGSSAAGAPRASASEAHDDATAAALQELLEEIRRSLHQRLDRLERRLEEHIEAAEARSARLEGEVRVLSSGPQLERGGPPPPAVSPELCCSLSGCATSQAGGAPRADGPLHGLPQPRPAPARQVQLPGARAACGGVEDPGRAPPAGPAGLGAAVPPPAAARAWHAEVAEPVAQPVAAAAVAAPVPARPPTACSGALLEESLAVVEAGTPAAPGAGGAGPQLRAPEASPEQAALGPLPAIPPPPPEDAGELVARLAEKYEDTRRLLARAQQQVGRAALAGRAGGGGVAAGTAGPP